MKGIAVGNPSASSELSKEAGGKVSIFVILVKENTCSQYNFQKLSASHEEQPLLHEDFLVLL